MFSFGCQLEFYTTFLCHRNSLPFSNFNHCGNVENVLFENGDVVYDGRRNYATHSTSVTRLPLFLQSGQSVQQTQTKNRTAAVLLQDCTHKFMVCTSSDRCRDESVEAVASSALLKIFFPRWIFEACKETPHVSVYEEALHYSFVLESHTISSAKGIACTVAELLGNARRPCTH